MLEPELKLVGRQRLASRGEALDGREVVGIHVLARQHAPHGGRAAERGDVVGLDEVQDLVAVEAVEVVDQLATFHKPLPIELAPGALGPTGVGDGHMHALGIHGMPPLGRSEVRGRVVMPVKGHLGLTRGAAGEVDEHGLVDIGGNAAQRLGGGAHASVVVNPTRAGARGSKEPIGARKRRTRKALVEFGTLGAGNVVLRSVHEEAQGRHHKLLAGMVDDIGDGTHRRGDDGLDARRLDAINHVMLLEHERCGNDDRANLVQG